MRLWLFVLLALLSSGCASKTRVRFRVVVPGGTRVDAERFHLAVAYRTPPVPLVPPDTGINTERFARGVTESIEVHPRGFEVVLAVPTSDAQLNVTAFVDRDGNGFLSRGDLIGNFGPTGTRIVDPGFGTSHLVDAPSIALGPLVR